MSTDTPTDVDTSATETDQLTVEEAADTVDQADLGEDDGAGTKERMFGQRRLRSEDPPLLTGESKFTDDLDLPGALWAVLVRSPFANATITSIDTAEAEAADGVVAVHTGAELADTWANPMPCAWPVTDDMVNPPHYPLAAESVRYVGDAVAVVLATTRQAAVDAAEQVIVDYDPLPAVVDPEAAATNEVLVHPDLGSNVCYDYDVTSDPDALEAEFANATHTVSERYIQQRLLPSAMEPRGTAVVPEPFGGGIVVYSSTQIPHILKLMLAITCGVPEHKVRVVTPAVGGGFGAKLNVYAEEVLCVTLAIKHGKPVRWTETRSEAAQATTHGRGQVQYIELAADERGKVSAMKVRLVGDMGAYLQLLTPGIPLLGGFIYHGVYDIGNYSFKCQSVFTNAVPTDAYRGAGRPEATYAIERAMDALAREMGVTPEEIRRRNYIQPEQFPYTNPTGAIIMDSGNYEPTMARALEMAGIDELRAEQQRRRDAGDTKVLGIGICTYMEMCGLAPSRTLAALNYSAGGWEAATVRMLPTGGVQVVTGTSPHGQGHETSWAMLVADQMGIDPDLIEVLHSDTAISPLGLDTYGSRSLSVGGTAVHLATEKVIEKAKRIAAHLMEASPDDLEVSAGTLQVKGTPTKSMTLQEVAFAAFAAHDLPEGEEPNLEAQVSWDPPNFTFPFGTHIAIVEIDTETGEVRLQRYIAVDDCGPQVNPLIVEGQLHGGILQGVAQALWEEAVYDADGQLRTVTLGDYLVPSAMETPNFELDHTVTPSPSNPLGVKGVGEAGTIGSAPTVMNAVVDGLSHLGITAMDMPASPHRVWSAIQSTGQSADAEKPTAQPEGSAR